MKKFEAKLRNLQAALEQAQTILTSPEVGRLSLKEQLSHRQVSKKNLGWTGDVAQSPQLLPSDHRNGSGELMLKLWAWPVQHLGGRGRQTRLPSLHESQQGLHSENL